DKAAVVFVAGGRAGRKVEVEAELGQKTELEAHHPHSGGVGVTHVVHEVVERRVDFRVRITFGKQATQSSDMDRAVDRMRRGQKLRGAKAQAFGGKSAEVLVEPRAPYDVGRGAGPQHRPQPRTRPGPAQPEMTPQLAR